MIYVVQESNSVNDYRPIYAGSSAHEALMAANKVKSCRVTLWKNGKRFVIEEEKK